MMHMVPASAPCCVCLGSEGSGLPAAVRCVLYAQRKKLICLTVWGTTCFAGMIRETYSTPREGILKIESTTIVGDRSETCIQVRTLHDSTLPMMETVYGHCKMTCHHKAQ